MYIRSSVCLRFYLKSILSIIFYAVHGLCDFSSLISTLLVVKIFLIHLNYHHQLGNMNHVSHCCGFGHEKCYFRFRQIKVQLIETLSQLLYVWLFCVLTIRSIGVQGFDTSVSYIYKPCLIDVKIKGGSPFWFLHLHDCQNVVLHRL